MSTVRRHVLVLSAVSLVALASVACGKPGASKDGKAGTTTLTSANAPKGGSCNQAKAGTCTEYADNALGLTESACKDLIKGTYAKDNCPTANLMGTCERKGDKKFYYFGGSQPWVSDAQKSCEQDGLEPGKFTAQAGAEQAAKDKAIPTAANISGSCVSSGGTCEDLYGEMADLQKSMCEQFDGKYSTTPCTSEKLVGSCVKSGKVERLYEKDLKFQKVADLQNSCEKYAIPFGHWYANPDFKPAAAPAAGGKAAAPAGAKKKAKKAAAPASE